MRYPNFFYLVDSYIMSKLPNADYEISLHLNKIYIERLPKGYEVEFQKLIDFLNSEFESSENF